MASTFDKHRLVRRLIIAVILFSSLITLVATAFQLYRDYDVDRAQIDQRLLQIQEVHSPALAYGLWALDKTAVQILLEGIYQLQDIEQLAITEGDKPWITVGSETEAPLITREYPLIYQNRGQQLEIGQLTVSASLQGIYQRLIDKAIVILISNAIKTFLVAGFILYIFHLLVTRHIFDIMQYLDKQALSSEFYPFRFKRKKPNHNNPDELEQLVEKLNQAYQNLHVSTNSYIKAEEKYRLAMEATQDGIWDFNVLTNEVFYSPGWKKILRVEYIPQGYDEWEERIHPDDKEPVLTSLQSHLSGESDFWQEEHRLLRNDGEYVWVLGRGGVIARDVNGKPLRMVGTMTDISGRKQAEQALRVSEENYRKLIEDIPDVVYRTDRDERISFVTPSVERLTGYSTEELLGMNPQQDLYVSPEARDKMLQVIRQNGRIDNFETRLKRKDGSIWWGSANAHVLLDSNGRYDGVEGVVRDITDRKEAETALHEAKKAAEQANQAKSEFLAVMSHEIRTPMNGVMGMSSVLLDTKLNQEQRQAVEIIHDSAEALLTILSDILDFSKLEAHRVQLENTEFDLHALVSDVASVFKPHANIKQIDLVQELPEVNQYLFKGDRGRIRQILMNLIGNAVKFTEAGQITTKVSLSDVDQLTKNVRFEIQDTGIGIASDKLDILFDSFAQADASITSKYGGSGLGLAICRGLVEVMQGEIGVRSELGKGSEFWFAIPLEFSADAGRIAEIDSQPMPPVVDRQHPLQILLAEDVATNQLVAKRLIEKFGHQVEIAGNGEEVLQALESRDYDLIFMDVRMPEMDGLSATREIRRMDRLKDIHIIAMTANATKEDMQECMNAGMNDFVSKPIHKSKIEQALTRFFHERHA
ncbi:MAG: PAS domain S-box protein [Gammaproteobacteria bacterium]|nr:PAS domain S-box protein [Gammaproteobacteria bacterium]